MTRPTILLNPGPVTLTQRVREALRAEDLCHREPEFAALLLDVRERLVRVHPACAQKHEAIVVSGSGTSAVEAMLQSFAPDARRALVVANGVYGERMTTMLEAAGKSPAVVRSDWLEPIDLARVEERLTADASLTHVVAVHNETTSGRLNDLASLGALCKRLGRALLLDAVSSFGAERIAFADWNLVALASTANKCLHGAPGISFVLARKDVLDAGASFATSVYLDLFRYRKEQERGSSPFTSAVHVLFALREALRELEETGGLEVRRARYVTLSARVRRCLAGLGVEPLIEPAEMSCMISSFRVPEGVSYDELHDSLKERGFVVYAGQGPLAGRVFRVANMGDIRDEDVDRLVAAFEELLG